MFVLTESYRLTRARTSTGVCLRGERRSHWAEVIKSHGQTWIRPTRLRYCNFTSVREPNNRLLAQGKLMTAFQQICAGSRFCSGNEPFLKIALGSKRQSERRSEFYYRLSLENIWNVFFHCCIFPYFLWYLSHPASFPDAALSLNPFFRLLSDPESLALILFYHRRLLGVKRSSC